MVTTLKTIVSDLIRALIVVVVFVILFAASLVGLAWTDISGHCDTVKNPTMTIVVCAMPIPSRLLPQQGGNP